MQEKNLNVIIGHYSNWIKVRPQVRRLYLRFWASGVHPDRLWTTGDYIYRNTAALHRETVR